MSSLILQKILELNFLYPFYFDLTWFFRAISFKNTMLIKLKKNSDRFIIVPKQPFTWNYMAYTRYIDCWCIKLCYQFKLYSIEYLIRTKCYWQGQRKKKKTQIWQCIKSYYIERVFCKLSCFWCTHNLSTTWLAAYEL